MRTCAKLRCGARATVSVALSYEDRDVLVGDLTSRADPRFVDLCDRHAEALRPPIGWRVTDVRAPVAAGS